MKLFQRLRQQPEYGESFVERAGLVNLFETWASEGKNEKVDQEYVSYVRDGMQANGIVWALILMRMTFFSQMEFQWQHLEERELFEQPGLALLQNPWPNGSTAELLARCEQDISCAGNAYIYKAKPDQLQRLRPDWVEIITDGSTPIGYTYTPGGATNGPKKYINTDEMAHWSPYPDPLAAYKGMSWLTPMIREILADKQMTRHKQKFFDNAATPNLLIKNTKLLDETSRNRLQRALESRYDGADNAYRTLVLEGGADATIIGSSLQQMSFDTVQAAGENRIAAAAGVPGIVAGFKEGLQAATYSNYAQAKRHFVDGTLTFMWASVSKALEAVVTVPDGARLWYDTSRIPALKEDRLAQAEIVKAQGDAASAWVKAGYNPQDVEVYITTGERPTDGIRHVGLVFVKGAEAEPGTGLVSETSGVNPDGSPAPGQPNTNAAGNGAAAEPTTNEAANNETPATPTNGNKPKQPLTKGVAKPQTPAGNN